MSRAFNSLLPGAVAFALLTTHAQAQDIRVQSPPAAVTPDGLIDRGVELRRNGEHAQALVLFEQAYALDPSPRALAQIGLAEHALAHWRRAYDTLSRALESRHDAWITRRRELLESARNEARDRLGELYVEADASQLRETVEVWINGERRAELPVQGPLLTEAGRVEVELRASGRVLVRSRATVDSTVPARVSFASLVVPDETSPFENTENTGENDTQSSSGLTTAAWSLVGVSAAALGVGIGFHIAAEHKDSYYVYNPHARELCQAYQTSNGGGTEACDATALLYGANRNTYLGLAIAGDVVAGLSLATAVTLFVLDARRDESLQSAFTCGPAFTLGVACSGRF